MADTVRIDVELTKGDGATGLWAVIDDKDIRITGGKGHCFVQTALPVHTFVVWLTSNLGAPGKGTFEFRKAGHVVAEGALETTAAIPYEAYSSTFPRV